MMAWTRSTPRRGKCANFQPAALTRLSAPWSLETATPADRVRITLLAIAAAMALFGAIVPHLTIETMAISAILVATLCCAAAALMSENFIASLLPRTQAAEPAQGPAASLCGADKRVRNRGFDEIAVVRQQHHLTQSHQIDRQHWSKLTAHMSHELRTPLNAVIGFSELIAKEAFGPVQTDCYKDYAHAINESGRTLLKSVEDALAITALLTSGKQVNGNASCCLTSELTEALAHHAVNFEARELSIESSDAAASLVCGEQTTIRQLLINTLSHAAKLADRDSKITIEQQQTATGCILKISAPVNAPSAITAQGQTAFDLMLAKTLADLSTIRLIEEHDVSDLWSIQICMQRPTQPDFFADCETRTMNPQRQLAL